MHTMPRMLRYTTASKHAAEGRAACADERSTSDWNNALKLGYDVAALAFLPGLAGHAFSPALPATVLQPGATLARVSPRAAAATGLPPSCEVAAGTTDSIAAFLASGAAAVGDAVTSLGSTMAIKLLSDRPVDDGRYGVYSHRLGAPPQACLPGPAQLPPGRALCCGTAVTRPYITPAPSRRSCPLCLLRTRHCTLLPARLPCGTAAAAPLCCVLRSAAAPPQARDTGQCCYCMEQQ